ncbi:ribonuclease J [Listeria sp. FSL L7-0091]|uniref:Ribonuclease J n=1 Tax=Listeria farberi TaxID=2713500 RepID=A0A7X0ZGR6_9LIST|nr:ribonuclease J [Listeria farberi]MBC1374164.1 ribonuclease J [Listeria farberi]MBC1381184.1 ribonuclease J [Listeria farberi]MBC2260808.1 ribonuclease J [Listeria farberi]MBC2267392.1 ribonuclease J [Listeria farberi]MBC2286853.1 ribonuclease J [Listeria farberi]
MTIKKAKNIKIIPLGGVDESGKNLYVVEIDEDIFILDAGLMFPENELLGIDIVIPDFKYLEENKDRVKAIFLTHGHEDAIGALPYLLQKIKAPVYGTELTIALAKSALKEHRKLRFKNFHVVNEETTLSFSKIDVSFFRTTHTIPDSVGIVLETSEGSIIYTGDFKFDQSAKDGYASDLSHIAEFGEKGVLALLSDSSEAEHPGTTSSDSLIEEEIRHAFRMADGRIIVACVASNLIRLQQVLEASVATKRKVAIVGKELERVFEIAGSLGKIVIEEDLIVPLKEIKKYNDEEITIIETGNLGEPIQSLQLMTKGNHPQFNIKPGDTVYITTTPSPSLETMMAKTMDMLYKAGAKVLTMSNNLFISGHASQEDLKLMLNLLKPRYFVPVHGEYRMLISHAKLAHEVGMAKSEVFIVGKGEILEYKNDKMTAGNRVYSGNTLIDGLGVGDVGNIVLRDRKLLSEDGIFIVVVTLNRKTKTITSGPEIISRGFIYVRESEHLIEESSKVVTKIVEKNLQETGFEWAKLKQDIRDQLNRYLFEQTKRRPMILPIIMEV